MSVFEQIRPFVNLCQACGMIPYAIENNLMTNKFNKFTFSFKHRVARWFLFILALQIAIVCLARYFSVSKQDDISTDQSLPITIKILSAVNSISSLVQLLFSRWIVLRYRRLQRAIEAVQQVERLFGEEFIAQHKSSLKTRIIIGFILILVTVRIGKESESFKSWLFHLPFVEADGKRGARSDTTSTILGSRESDRFIRNGCNIPDSDDDRDDVWMHFLIHTHLQLHNLTLHANGFVWFWSWS